MKRIAILGSTGSIGTSALQVVDHLHNQLEVTALAAFSNVDLLEAQVRKYGPKLVALFDPKAAAELRRRLPGLEVLEGMEGVCAVAGASDSDLVLSAMSGTMGLSPTMAAIEAGKDVALANKEALVSGGALVMERVKEKGVQLIPVDSEHSALFQCLQGENPKALRRMILTASGGPFRNHSAESLSRITVEEALGHPTWKMGPKITVDSSTLMNKGLEVIEAHWLFGVPPEQIDVVVHPSSVIHSIVEFCDGSLLAQLGETTMTTPIQYALTYPERHPGMLKPFDLVAASPLQFFQPDPAQFRCLALAFEALKAGGSLPCYMNAANEVLVHRFLGKQIGWCDIALKLEKLMENHENRALTSLEQTLAVDEQARCEAITV